LRAEKLLKKARRAELTDPLPNRRRLTRAKLAQELFELAAYAQGKGWSAEDLLLTETRKHERKWRKRESPT
jgi:hypothetical protein